MSDISRDLRIGVQCYNVRSCEWCILYAATKLKMAMHDVYCVCVCVCDQNNTYQGYFLECYGKIFTVNKTPEFCVFVCRHRNRSGLNG